MNAFNLSASIVIEWPPSRRVPPRPCGRIGRHSPYCGAGSLFCGRPPAGLPHLLAGPAPGPREVDERITGRRALGRIDLDEILDVEAAPPEEPNPFAGAHVELDPRGVGPFEAVHAA